VVTYKLIPGTVNSKMAAQTAGFVGDVCSVMCGPGPSGPYRSPYFLSFVAVVHDVSAVADCEEAQWQQFLTQQKVLSGVRVKLRNNFLQSPLLAQLSNTTMAFPLYCRHVRWFNLADLVASVLLIGVPLCFAVS
jgi:hypothetical protein